MSTPTDVEEAQLRGGQSADHAARIKAERGSMAKAPRPIGVVKSARNLMARARVLLGPWR